MFELLRQASLANDRARADCLQVIAVQGDVHHAKRHFRTRPIGDQATETLSEVGATTMDTHQHQFVGSARELYDLSSHPLQHLGHSGSIEENLVS